MSVLIFQSNCRTEINFGFVIGSVSDDDGFIESLAQVTNTTVNFSQPLFTIDVLGIFRSVSESGGFRD